VIVRVGVSIASAAEVADKAPLLACASAIGKPKNAESQSNRRTDAVMQAVA